MYLCIFVLLFVYLCIFILYFYICIYLFLFEHSEISAGVQIASRESEQCNSLKTIVGWRKTMLALALKTKSRDGALMLAFKTKSTDGALRY